jgi:signal peptidase I
MFFELPSFLNGLNNKACLGEKLPLKIIIIAIAIVLTFSVVGAVVYVTQINPMIGLDTEKYQVLTFTTTTMEPTIMEGHRILVDKQVNPHDLKTDYPDSDIIVYYTPDHNSFVASRIVSVEEVDGKLVFRTKGDSNAVTKYPDMPSMSECDPWEVTEDMIFGKVVDTDY